MAAPSYATDLQYVTNAESGTWAELAGRLSDEAVADDWTWFIPVELVLAQIA